jgi:hypothetical protein
MNKFPEIIWVGRDPVDSTHGRRFRLIDQGPKRENKNDLRFGVEKLVGVNRMHGQTWVDPHDVKAEKIEGNLLGAVRALADLAGRVLQVDPANLVAGHPICCDLNMAVLEARVPRGCDCDAPTVVGRGKLTAVFSAPVPGNLMTADPLVDAAGEVAGAVVHEAGKPDKIFDARAEPTAPDIYKRLVQDMTCTRPQPHDGPCNGLPCEWAKQSDAYRKANP